MSTKQLPDVMQLENQINDSFHEEELTRLCVCVCVCIIPHCDLDLMDSAASVKLLSKFAQFCVMFVNYAYAQPFNVRSCFI